jgi:hypothetical protein
MDSRISSRLHTCTWQAALQDRYNAHTCPYLAFNAFGNVKVENVSKRPNSLSDWLALLLELGAAHVIGFCSTVPRLPLLH